LFVLQSHFWSTQNKEVDFRKARKQSK